MDIRELPALADKDGVEVCWLSQEAWDLDVNSGHAVYWYDAEEAQRWVDFFPEFIKHNKGRLAGKPVELVEWQSDYVKRLYGWKKISDNFRRYTKSFFFVPRKNAKTQVVGGLGLGHLTIDGEGGPEVYCGASTEKQAKVLFNTVKYSVKKSPALLKILDPLKDVIDYEDEAGVFQALSGDAETQEGLNPSAFFGDEVHVWKTFALLEVMETGMAVRDQPMTILLTTAGASKLNSPAYQEYDYAKKVRDGLIIDPTYLPLIFEAPADAEIDDWDAIKQANPMFGISLQKEFFENKIRKAKHVPALVNSFKRHHMNIWTSAEDKWIEMSKWLAVKGKFDPWQMRGRRCYAALDLGMIDDLSALVLWFPALYAGEKHKVWAHFWCPEVSVEKRHALSKVHFDQWKDHITATQGETTDFDFIEKTIIDLNDFFQIEELAFDPHNANFLCTHLANAGVKVFAHRQGFISMNEPIRALISNVLNQSFIVDNPALDWMADNGILVMDAHNNLKFDKSKTVDKIDGLVALAMACGRADLHREDDTDPFEGGLRTV